MDPSKLPLRDIHLPGNLSWWPPAIGWWILLGLFILLAALTLWWFRRRDKIRRSAVNQTKLQLQMLRAEYQQSNDLGRLAQALSSLLRRLSISLLPRQEVAGLTGDKWLAFLDQFMTDKPFTTGAGRILSEAPYSKQTQFDSEQLLSLCEQWVERIAVAQRKRQ